MDYSNDCHIDHKPENKQTKVKKKSSDMSALLFSNFKNFAPVFKGCKKGGRICKKQNFTTLNPP